MIACYMVKIMNDSMFAAELDLKKKVQSLKEYEHRIICWESPGAGLHDNKTCYKWHRKVASISLSLSPILMHFLIYSHLARGKRKLF